MRILLIQPPIEDFYTTPIRLYPLNLLYVASVLRLLDVDVQVFDCLTPLKKRRIPIPDDFSYLRPLIEAEPLMFRNYYRFGLETGAILEVISDFSPDLIGVSAQFTAYYKNVADLAESIKRRFSLPIFVGGHHATVFASAVGNKTPAIDYVLPGPAEEALPAFISTHRSSKSMETSVLDWKSLIPAHDLLPGDAYRIGRRNAVSMTASRGCPYACDFCSIRAMFGVGIEYRRVEDVLKEMRLCYASKSARIFNFEDDNLAADKKWFTSFLESVIADPILRDVELTAMNGIGYTLLDIPLLRLMKKAGFRQLNLSYVTHDDTLRRRYGRPHAHKKISQLITEAGRLNFFITVYVIVGLPGQTYTEIKNSIDYLLDMGVLVGPSIFYIPPGSALYDRLQLPAAVLENWNLYRSSAYAVESEHLSRPDLVELFAYTRRRNLENKSENKPAPPAAVDEMKTKMHNI